MGKWGKPHGVPFGALEASSYDGFYDYSGASQVSCFSSFVGYTGPYLGWSATDIPSGSTGAGPVFFSEPGVIFDGFGDPPAGFSLFSGTSAFSAFVIPLGATGTIGATGSSIWAFSGFSNFQKDTGISYFTTVSKENFTAPSFSVSITVPQFDSGTITDAQVLLGDLIGETGFDIGGLTIDIDPPFGASEAIFSGAPGFNYLGITGMPSGNKLSSRSYNANIGGTGFGSTGGLWFGATSVGEWNLNISYTGDGVGEIQFVTLCLDHLGEFTSYEGFSGTDVSSCSGFSGFTGFSGLDAAFIPFPPKITVPTASAILEGISAQVAWLPLATDFFFLDEDIVYDLEWTDNFDSNIGWSPIQNGIDGRVFSFLWDTSDIPNSDNLSLRMRSRLCDVPSAYYTLPGPFTIAPRPPEAPILLNPLGFETFDSQIPIVWEPASPLDIDLNDVIYTIQYSRSASSDQGWRDIAVGLSSSITSFLFDSSGLAPGVDYGIRIFAVATDTGQRSEIQTVRGLKIKHSGFFIVDTLPPEAEIIIEEDIASAVSQNINVRFRLKDPTSGVKGVRLKNENEDSFSDLDTPVEEKYWILSKGDGYKNVLLEAEDFAGNKTNNLEINAVLRRFKEEDNLFDVEVFNDKVYIGTGSAGISAKLYNFLAIGALTKEFDDANRITALKAFRNNLYIGVADADNIGKIYVFNGATCTLSKDFLVSNTVVNTMEVYVDPETAADPTVVSDDTLFAGLSNGEIHAFNVLWTFEFAASASVLSMRNVNSTIMGSLENSSKFVIFNGAWSEVTF